MLCLMPSAGEGGGGGNALDHSVGQRVGMRMGRATMQGAPSRSPRNAQGTWVPWDVRRDFAAEVGSGVGGGALEKVSQSLWGEGLGAVCSGRRCVCCGGGRLLGRGRGASAQPDPRLCCKHLQGWPLPSPPPPCVTFHRVAVSLGGPGQSTVLPFACCVRSLRSVGRCSLCFCWCRLRVGGAQ